MKKIVVKCKELKDDPGIPLATLNKLERTEAYLKNHKSKKERKEERT
ncbi:MAG: hypothetical protein AABY32_04665 [Nanoarchaeota archaeon]